MGFSGIDACDVPRGRVVLQSSLPGGRVEHYDGSFPITATGFGASGRSGIGKYGETTGDVVPLSAVFERKAAWLRVNECNTTLRAGEAVDVKHTEHGSEGVNYAIVLCGGMHFRVHAGNLRRAAEKAS